MRPVKFRVWDKECNDWVRGEIVIDSEGDLYLSGPKDKCVSAKEEGYKLEVNWFTGLLDKNGKEIYEGDMVRTWVRYADGKDYPHNLRTKVIEWSESDKYTGWKIGKGKWEVIGNIWENPDLLQEAAQ